MSCLRKIDSSGAEFIGTLSFGQTIGNMVAGGIQARSQAAAKTGSMSQSMGEDSRLLRSMLMRGDFPGDFTSGIRGIGDDLSIAGLQAQYPELSGDMARTVLGLRSGATAGASPSSYQGGSAFTARSDDLILPGNLTNGGGPVRVYAATNAIGFPLQNGHTLAGWTNDRGDRIMTELMALGANQRIEVRNDGAHAIDRLSGEDHVRDLWRYESDLNASRSGPETWYDQNSPSYMADRSNQIAFREGPYTAANDVMQPYGMFVLGVFGAAIAAPAVPGVIAWGGANIPLLTEGSIIAAEVAAGDALGGATLAGAGGAVVMHYGDDAIRASQRALERGAGALDTVTVFRVEGAGNQRLVIGGNGGIDIPEVFTRSGSERNLYLNFGDESRAQDFLQQRLGQFPDSTIKSFEVPRSFLDDLRATAVPENSRSLFPARPVIADPTKAADQFGLSRDQIEQLRRVAVQGSGRQR